MTDLGHTAPLEQALPLSDTSMTEEMTPSSTLADFTRLFETISRGSEATAKENRVPSEVSVGNPTAMCHPNGGSDKEGESYGEDKPRGEGVNSQSFDWEGGENKSRDNEVLECLPLSFNSGGDRRVYANFEDAGLPRRELTRLARVLQNSAVAGRRTVSVGINLPEIGAIRFDVRIDNKTVFIHAFVESERAAAALALAISALRDKLEEHDLLLGRLDVTTQDEQEAKKRSASEGKQGSKKKRIIRIDGAESQRGKLENENGLIHVLA